MLPIAQATVPRPTNGVTQGLPPLPEGPDLSRLRAPQELGAEAAPWALPGGLLILLGLVVLFAWLYRQSRRPKRSALDPLEAARAEIGAARQAADDDGRFVALCSGAVRRLLLTRYQLPQQGLTNEELTAKLPLEKELKEQLRHFFGRCDNVKFARESLDPFTRSELGKTAERIIGALETTTGEGAGK